VSEGAGGCAYDNEGTTGSHHSYDQVWWVNLDSVEFSWHTDLGRDTKPSDPRFPFIAIYTSLPARRFTVDTLKEQPNFRTAGKR
jgi:hypothetical protein